MALGAGADKQGSAGELVPTSQVPFNCRMKPKQSASPGSGRKKTGLGGQAAGAGRGRKKTGQAPRVGNRGGNAFEQSLRAQLKLALDELDTLDGTLRAWKKDARRAQRRSWDSDELLRRLRTARLAQAMLKELGKGGSREEYWWRAWWRVLEEVSSHEHSLFVDRLRVAGGKSKEQELWHEFRNRSFMMSMAESALTVEDVDSLTAEDWLGQMLKLYRSMSAALWQRLSSDGVKPAKDTEVALKAWAHSLLLLSVDPKAAAKWGRQVQDQVLSYYARLSAGAPQNSFGLDDVSFLLDRPKAIRWLLQGVDRGVQELWELKRGGAQHDVLREPARNIGSFVFVVWNDPALLGGSLSQAGVQLKALGSAAEDAVAQEAANYLLTVQVPPPAGKRPAKNAPSSVAAYDRHAFLSVLLEASGYQPDEVKKFMGFLKREERRKKARWKVKAGARAQANTSTGK